MLVYCLNDCVWFFIHISIIYQEYQFSLNCTYLLITSFLRYSFSLLDCILMMETSSAFLCPIHFHSNLTFVHYSTIFLGTLCGTMWMLSHSPFSFCFFGSLLFSFSLFTIVLTVFDGRCMCSFSTCLGIWRSGGSCPPAPAQQLDFKYDFRDKYLWLPSWIQISLYPLISNSVSL